MLCENGLVSLKARLRADDARDGSPFKTCIAWSRRGPPYKTCIVWSQRGPSFQWKGTLSFSGVFRNCCISGVDERACCFALTRLTCMYGTFVAWLPFANCMCMDYGISVKKVSANFTILIVWAKPLMCACDNITTGILWKVSTSLVYIIMCPTFWSMKS